MGTHVSVVERSGAQALYIRKELTRVTVVNGRIVVPIGDGLLRHDDLKLVRLQVAHPRKANACGTGYRNSQVGCRRTERRVLDTDVVQHDAAAHVLDNLKRQLILSSGEITGQIQRIGPP